MLNDRVDNELPAFKVDILNALNSKAELSDVVQRLETKVDKEQVEHLVERVNEMQE